MEGNLDSSPGGVSALAPLHNLAPSLCSVSVPIGLTRDDTANLRGQVGLVFSSPPDAVLVLVNKQIVRPRCITRAAITSGSM